MPDASRECDLIMEQLREIRDMHIAHASSVRTEINFIKDSLSKIDVIETAIEEMKRQDAREKGMFDGVTWTLAKLGAGVVLLLAGIGWLTTGGGLVWIKEHI